MAMNNVMFGQPFIYYILPQLSLNDVLSMSQINREMTQLFQDENIWLQLTHSKYPALLNQKSVTMTWKQYYMMTEYLAEMLCDFDLDPNVGNRMEMMQNVYMKDPSPSSRLRLKAYASGKKVDFLKKPAERISH